MMSTFYIWKWADNDLPGRPGRIVPALGAGNLPRAVQPFAQRRILRRLRGLATGRVRFASRLLIEARSDPQGQVRFIRIRCQSANPAQLADRLLWVVWKEDLSLFDGTTKRLESLPKRNVVEAEGSDSCRTSELLILQFYSTGLTTRRATHGSRSTIRMGTCSRFGNIFAGSLLSGRSFVSVTFVSTGSG